ncbi:MAG TPA: GTP cyclohydrolase I FolE2 [Archaeoglobaceae archaeon]|nr:GTP cyclohydrolase I FolE2 [Archaeoglobaceae archaeon]
MLPDVQTLKPDIPVGLSRVGATGIKKLVKVDRGEGKRPVILISIFDIFVDLLPDRKGVNLSRNFEAIDEVLEKLTAKPIKKIEELNLKIVDELLERHEYATRAEVKMESELILIKKTPVTKQRTQEVVKILCNASRSRENSDKKIFIGSEVAGITVCPCAQELVKSKAGDELRKYFSKEQIEKIFEIIPVATHNQRGKATIKVQITDEFRPDIDELIEIARNSMSYQLHEILKREDELEVVKAAHSNPRFVEDVVREMARSVVQKFRDAPDNIVVYFRHLSEESIHQHNVVAERTATLGELRNEIMA